jgi:predicted transcriptional regulator
MKRRRNSFDIVADILSIAKCGAKKTRIVYGANINFKLLQKYLEELEEAGLIVNGVDRKGFIKTTEKGVRYLSHYRGFREFNVLEVAQ